MMRAFVSGLTALSLFVAGLLLGLRVDSFNRGFIAIGEFLLWPSILIAGWAGLTWFKRKIDARRQTVESFK